MGLTPCPYTNKPIYLIIIGCTNPLCYVGSNPDTLWESIDLVKIRRVYLRLWCTAMSCGLSEEYISTASFNVLYRSSSAMLIAIKILSRSQYALDTLTSRSVYISIVSSHMLYHTSCVMLIATKILYKLQYVPKNELNPSAGFMKTSVWIGTHRVHSPVNISKSQANASDKSKYSKEYI